ncbi:hypothetical protein ACQRA4_11030, partial [Desulfovibrio sp. SGI.169]
KIFFKLRWLMSQTPTGKRIKTQYTGIYYRFGKDRMCPDGKPDRRYDITYKDRKTGKFVFEKVGLRSEGYTVRCHEPSWTTGSGKSSS